MTEAAVAGTYGALANYNISGGYHGMQETEGGSVVLYDLQTGALLFGRGGEQTACQYIADQRSCEIDQLVLGSDAVSAVHTTTRGQDLNGTYCTCTVEQIQASDSTGARTLDSITQPNGSPTALTNLTLTGDTLTWQRNGGPRSAQLQP